MHPGGLVAFEDDDTPLLQRLVRLGRVPERGLCPGFQHLFEGGDATGLDVVPNRQRGLRVMRCTCEVKRE